MPKPITNQQPMRLVRTFRDLHDERMSDIETLAAFARAGLPGGIDWDELLKSRRVLLISEAGAGKTFECRTRRDAMWAAGEPAFFLELVELARSPVREMLDVEEEIRFDAWLAAEHEIATFFLDSIDELKLTQGSFERALKRLAKALDGNLDRARIVITTRPVPFDEELVRRHLPAPGSRLAEGLGASFADVATRRIATKADDGAKRWINVALMPLSDDEIRTMAAIERIADPDDMIADLRTRDAMDFARRPQDLIELCADWRDHQRIRTHREQVGSNVGVKLKPRIDHDRPETADLSADRARDGASRLALAMLLTRRLTIRHAAEADRGGTPGTALDPAVILPDWAPQEVRTLLERPMFGFASYGRVRFHHRSVLEFLAAERLDRLLESGVPVRTVKRLLLAETAQGDQVVRPAMRAVAGWLAGSRDAIFDAVLAREPEVLLDHGDPQSLDVSRRARALRAYVERHGAGGWRGLATPYVQVHRFASPDLSPLVAELWSRGIENPEVRDLLLSLIGAAGMVALADIPLGVARDGAVASRERIEAIDTLMVLNDARLTSIGTELVAGSPDWPDRLAETIALRLFPMWLGVDPMLRLLRRLPDRSSRTADLGWHLANLVAAVPLETADLDVLREGLASLVVEGVAWRSDWPHLSASRPRLLACLAETCLRQMEAGSESARLLASCAVAIRFHNDDKSHGRSMERLRTSVGELSPEARSVMFWSDDAFVQSLHEHSDAAERLFEIDRALKPRSVEDEPWVLAALGDRGRTEMERAMMIELALREFRSDGSYADHASRLRGLVSDSPHLLAVVDLHATPREVDGRVQQWIEEDERREREGRERDAACRQTWVDFWSALAADPATHFAEERTGGTVWTLWQVMRRSPADGTGSGWNRRFIEEHLGHEVANRLRIALMAAWRLDRPTLPHERRGRNRGRTLLGWELGLSGIYAEAEDPEWARSLTSAQAELAARYVPLEPNALPAWLEGLIDAHPEAVDKVVGDLLQRDLDGPATSPHWHSSLLQAVGYATPAIATAFLPRLRAWFVRRHRRNRKAEDPAAVGERLDRVARILLGTGLPSDRELVRVVAVTGILSGKDGSFRLWLPILTQVDPKAGTDLLEARIARAEDRAAEALEWFASLFGDRGRGSGLNLGGGATDPWTLLRLVRLAYAHVRREDDAEHEGSYTPDVRDDAERGRDAVLGALFAATGPDAWHARLALASDPLFAHLRDRVLAVARERAAEEADGAPLSPAAAAEFDRSGERPVLTRDGMASALRDGLDDVMELLLQDVSPREAWAGFTEERILRREIARALRDRPGRSYTVDQEAATADEKETDIRMRSTASHQQAVIELKIGDKARSAADLRDALETQLLGKYMASDECRVGCLLISLSKDRFWTHPPSGTKLTLADLCAWLNEECMKLCERLGGAVRLDVRALDLRRRLATEAANPPRRNQR